MKNYWLPFTEAESRTLDALAYTDTQVVSLCFGSFQVYMQHKLMVNCETNQQYRLRKIAASKVVQLPTTKLAFECMLKLIQCGFGPEDAAEAVEVCNADESKAIPWLVSRMEDADLSLRLNQAMDQSRQQYEIELKTRGQWESEERDTCNVFSYAPFQKSVLAQRVPFALRPVVVGETRALFINLIDLELKAISWYPRSKAYFEGLAARIERLEKGQFTEFVRQAGSEVQEALYGLPEMSGSIPRLFRTEECADDDEVECVSPPPSHQPPIEFIVVED